MLGSVGVFGLKVPRVTGRCRGVDKVLQHIKMLVLFMVVMMRRTTAIQGRCLHCTRVDE